MSLDSRPGPPSDRAAARPAPSEPSAELPSGTPAAAGGLHRPTVVKLGGSLAAADSRLRGWLDVLGALGGRAVLVPGGGPFADQVRSLQRRWGFDDAVAHRLALLAMEQYGRMLAGLGRGLIPAPSRAAIRRILGQGRVPVWMPTRMVAGRSDIPASWQVTSDSLALWLAGQLQAERLCLIKSAPAPEGPLVASDLADRGLVDGAFPRFLAQIRCRVCYLGPERPAALAEALRGPGPSDGLTTIATGDR